MNISTAEYLKLNEVAKLVENNKPHIAESILHDLIDHIPDNRIFSRTLGLLYLKQEKFKESIALFETLVRDTHFDPVCVLDYAKALRGGGDRETAISVLSGTLAKVSSLSPGWFLLGDIFVENGQYEQAKNAYQHAVANDPFRIQIEQVKSSINTGDTAKSKRILVHILEQDASHVEALCGMAVLSMQSNENVEAKRYFDRALTRTSYWPTMLLGLSQLFLSSSKAYEAKQTLQTLIQIEPASIMAWNMLGTACELLMQNEEAKVAYEHSLSLNSRKAESKALINKIFRAAAIGDRKTAIYLLKQIIDSDAAIGSMWFDMARVALSLGELSIAEVTAIKTLKADRNNVEYVVQCCAILSECRKFDLAIELLKPLLSVGTVNSAVQHLAGTIYQQMGEYDFSEKHLRSALKSSDGMSGATWLALSAQIDFKWNSFLFEKLQFMEKRISKSTEANCIPYYYALGKALLDREYYDDAFDKLSEGARLARARKPFKAENERRYVDSIIENFANDAFSPMNGNSLLLKEPIFIVGLPRSGTTLLEQILTSHKDVADGGECDGIRLATMYLGKASEIRPIDLRTKTNNNDNPLAKIANTYIHVAGERFGRSGIVVDKSINNVFYLGVIAEVFPKSPIIHIERNIEDVAWSCFRTCFSVGMHWSYSLSDIVAHFKSVNRLISHWKDVLGDRIISVKYEDLVCNAEVEIPRLLEKCNLEGDLNVFEFYKSSRPVTTSSTIQVRKPLYRDAISSSNHIAHRMKPFIDEYFSG